MFLEFYFYHCRFGSSDDTRGILTVILLAVSAAEFVITLTAAIFTCQFGCCDEGSCCADSQKGNETNTEENNMKSSRNMHLTRKTVSSISCLLLGFHDFII